MTGKILRTLAIENDLIRFSLSPASHSWQLEDKRAGVKWGSASGAGPWVKLIKGEEHTPISLSRVEEVDGALRCRFVRLGGREGGLALIFRLAGDALQMYIQPDTTACPMVEIFGPGLEASAGEDGEALLPIRMGLLIPANGKRSFQMKLGTYEYEGVHMGMAALFKCGAGLMMTWQDPYIRLCLERRLEEEAPNLRMSFEFSHTARSMELRCLGKADLSALAAAYRLRAEELGYRVTWSEKLKDHPQAAGLFGASNVKLWTALDRKMDENQVEQSVTVHWTFDEAAKIAEHLKNEVKLDRVLFHLGGWSRYGYDCRHPDIMPANPECGGNEGLADCSQRVKALGYLFCLHDNYQDIYRDAPSWDESLLQKQADGSPTLGGVWLGGRAYYTCAREALRLAQRPENLPMVKHVARPDAYFIDTTYAVGPQECFDPRHPLTRQEDIYWKAVLSDYARQVFGLFGSECGREWAVPHADFFEGLASVSGQYYHQLNPEEMDARPVPFFDMVFHDCIVIHGKYGYEPTQMAEQVIHHAAMGRALYYHSLGDHLYWQDPAGMAEAAPAEGIVDPALYTRAVGGWAEGMCLWDRFMKNTHELLSPLALRTSQAWIERYDFLDATRRVRRTTFSNGAQVVVNGSAANVLVEMPSLGKLTLPPFGMAIEAGDFAAWVAVEAQDAKQSAPALFTFTSLDGSPISEAKRLRVFHGFGSAQLIWHGQRFEVRREMEIKVQG